MTGGRLYRACVCVVAIENAAGFVREDIGQATHFTGFIKNAFGDGKQRLARLRHTKQALAPADKDFDAKLILQIANMTADA